MTFGHTKLVRQQKCNYKLGLLSPPNRPFLLHRPLEFLTAHFGNHWSKAMADAAVQSKIQATVFVACQSYQTNFCHGLEMKFASPSGGIQQAGTPETVAKNVTPCFTFG